MNISIVLVLLSVWFQGTAIPYKPFDEFEIQVDFNFKQRNAPNNNTVEMVETREDRIRSQNSTALRPYLILNLKLLKLSEEEVRAKATDNLGHIVFSKKVKVDDLLKIDMGFIDDVKGKITAHDMVILFSSKDRKDISQIHLHIKENGTFVVNDEIRGKF